MFLAFTLVCALLPAAASAAAIPDAPAAVILLDWETYAFDGVYEKMVPLRKTLPPEGWTGAGDVCHHRGFGGDYDTLEVRSLLTGERLLRVLEVWPDYGLLLFPPDSLIHGEIEHGHPNPPPRAVTILNLCGSPEEAGREAWRRVADTDIVQRIVGAGPVPRTYDVAVTDLQLTEGNEYAHWAVFVLARPPAPDDLALLRLEWPRTVATRRIPLVPEVRIHNFSDREIEGGANLTVLGPGGSSISAPARSIPADSTVRVAFPALFPSGGEDMQIAFRVKGGGRVWKDAYPENDTIDRSIRLVDEPVFRPISSARHPGSFPIRGAQLDFDGDGDIDVFQYDYEPRLLQNDGTGRFRDITAETPVPLPHWTRQAVCRDFDRDGFPDLLLIPYHASPMLLAGDGTGRFRDITPQAGLSGVTGHWQAAVLDLERDGDDDLIFQTHAQEWVMANDGNGHFTDVTAASGIVDPGQTEHVTTGDLNGDLYPDVFLANWNGPSHGFVNLGNGKFAEFPGPWNTVQYAREAQFVDYDRDGLPDIILARHLYTDSTLVYHHEGGLAFAQAPWSLPEAFHLGPGDFDQDGWTDLVLDNGLFLNRGGRFVDRTELLVDAAAEGAEYAGEGTAVDIDRDGDLDVCLSTVILANQGLPDAGPGNGGDRRGSATPVMPALARAPNPFLAGDAFSVELARAARVRIRVYDPAGRELARPVDRDLPAGAHRIGWEAVDAQGRMLPSGIYFYVTDSDGARERRKFLIVR